MITGYISGNREAVIELEVMGPKQQTQQVSAVIDTGFNGHLTLPGSLISQLKLQLAGNRRATLGNGNVVVLDVYFSKVFWHDLQLEVLVLQADGAPLVGMSLLYGSRVTLEVADGGNVLIEPLS